MITHNDNSQLSVKIYSFFGRLNLLIKSYFKQSVSRRILRIGSCNTACKHGETFHRARSRQSSRRCLTWQRNLVRESFACLVIEFKTAVHSTLCKIIKQNHIFRNERWKKMRCCERIVARVGQKVAPASL